MIPKKLIGHLTELTTVVDKSPAAKTKLLIKRSFVLKFISQVELNDS